MKYLLKIWNSRLADTLRTALGITLGAWSVLALIYGGLSLLFSDSLIYANLYLISLAWMIYVLHTSKWKWERTSTPAGFRLGRVDIEPGDEGGGI